MCVELITRHVSVVFIVIQRNIFTIVTEKRKCNVSHIKDPRYFWSNSSMCLGILIVFGKMFLESRQLKDGIISHLTRLMFLYHVEKGEHGVTSFHLNIMLCFAWLDQIPASTDGFAWLRLAE